MVLELRADLGGDGVRPRGEREVEVGAEGARELLGRDERLVEVPHEAVAHAVRLRLELDADRHERGRALRLRLVATRGRDASMTLRGDDGKYAEGVLLDLDYWTLVPV